MNELDCMIRDKDSVIEYWIWRAEQENNWGQKRPGNISITLTTLEFFLWCAARESKGAL